MIPVNYKERYKRILQKDKISNEEVKQFGEVVKHFKVIYPDWKKQQFS